MCRNLIIYTYKKIGTQIFIRYLYVRKWDYYNAISENVWYASQNNMHNVASVRLTGCGCTSARKIDMSRATNWSVLQEYKKADIHPLTYVRRAKNRQDNRSTWNLRLKLTNIVARSGKFDHNTSIFNAFFSLFNHLLYLINISRDTNLTWHKY